MKLSFERIGPGEIEKVEALVSTEIARHPQVWIFGGGHVGRALAGFLAALPVEAHLVESREAEIALVADGTLTHLAAMPESLVPAMAPGSAVVVMTHDHAIDLAIADAALHQARIRGVGMIGSRTKAARMRSRLRSAGHGEEALARFRSPIGVSGITSKEPPAIALAVASELMIRREAATTFHNKEDGRLAGGLRVV